MVKLKMRENEVGRGQGGIYPEEQHSKDTDDARGREFQQLAFLEVL